ncbi:MAG: hypothetical protein CBD94_01635 [Gammaproteobacteria bacterium TMED234]|jgi:hypothetical protein|nr:MAG: hypothetical protein CBD94_01635 [Gammaproteobacteria bacterium TMED234]|tara:strand:+ start:13489 stop:13809 length:321 start_codon:yes stop_codon:yes gene_type:complete
MATFYNKVVKNVDTGKIAVFQSTSDSTIVLSILVANTTGSTSADVTVQQDNSANGLEAYLARTIPVPAQSNLDVISNKFIIPSGKKIAVQSTVSGSMDTIVSYVEV